MPAARGHDLDALLGAVGEYVRAKEVSEKKSGKPLVMVEYILLGGVNDSAEDADKLAKLLVDDEGGHRFGAGRAMVKAPASDLSSPVAKVPPR